MPSTVTLRALAVADGSPDSADLDRWQAALALGLRAEGCPDPLTVLGAQWWFDAPERPGGPPRLDLWPEDQWLTRLTGLCPVATPAGPDPLPERCARELDAGRTPLIVTDAFLLPWCPEYRARHVEHGFAVVAANAGRLTAVDAYRNQADSGPAEPRRTIVAPATAAMLARAPRTRTVVLTPVSPAATAPPTVEPVTLLRENAAALSAWADTDPFAWFTEECRTAATGTPAFERFAEACRTVERRRRLFAAWLDMLAGGAEPPIPAGFAAGFREQVVKSWADVTRAAQPAPRRTRTGRTAANGAVKSLVAAAALAEQTVAAELVELMARAG